MAFRWTVVRQGTCIRTGLSILISMGILSIIFTQRATLADIWCQEKVLLEDQVQSSTTNSSSARNHTYGIGVHLHQILSENFRAMQCRGVVSTGIRRFENTIPLIFVITATYKRFTQKAELVRFSHVLKQVPNILWIVVEDSESKTAAIADFLSSSGVSHVYLSIGGTKRHNVKPKGVLPRNRALQYARESLKIKPRTSVIYIADDDNTYTLRLFEEMRYIRKIGVWPVGLTGWLFYESPVVVNGKVRDWFNTKRTQKKFPIDMAGFAITGELLMNRPNARFRINETVGFMESKFIESLGVTMDDLEPRADNCTKILVWHTRTKEFVPESGAQKRIQKDIKNDSNITYQIISSEV